MELNQVLRPRGQVVLLLAEQRAVVHRLPRHVGLLRPQVAAGQLLQLLLLLLLREEQLLDIVVGSRHGLQHLLLLV